MASQVSFGSPDLFDRIFSQIEQNDLRLSGGAQSKTLILAVLMDGTPKNLESMFQKIGEIDKGYLNEFGDALLDAARKSEEGMAKLRIALKYKVDFNYKITTSAETTFLRLLRRMKYNPSEPGAQRVLDLLKDAGYKPVSVD